jgi:hypothetical protein
MHPAAAWRERLTRANLQGSQKQRVYDVIKALLVGAVAVSAQGAQDASELQ